MTVVWQANIASRCIGMLQYYRLNYQDYLRLVSENIIQSSFLIMSNYEKAIRLWNALISQTQ